MLSENTSSREVQATELQTIRLENSSGIEVELLNLGAGLRSIRVPGKQGRINAVLGYSDTRRYLADPYYMGSTLGRYANRIAKSRLTLDGRTYELAGQPGGDGHCLHGGMRGFSGRTWKTIASDDRLSAQFKLVSGDGDQGFPGRVEASVRYRLLEPCKLLIEFRATTDANTVINLANHAYFNLNDDGSTAENHYVFINADRFTPVDNTLIPTGEIRSVDGTPFDFREPVLLSERLGTDDEQLETGKGYDHNFVLNRIPGETCLAATLRSPQSGLEMKVHSTQPGLQLYTTQWLGAPFRPFEGICLEAQRPPNAPNIPGFPGADLNPGMEYRQLTIYEFSVDC